MPPNTMELVSLWVGGGVGAVILILILEVIRGRKMARAAPSMLVDTPKTCAGCKEVHQAVDQIATELHAVKMAVADGIEHVDRVESRIRGSVKRARKELQERGLSAPGLEAEASGLSLVDDEGGAGPSMPVMPARVAEDQSSVPGVTPEQLRRVRGI